MDANTQFEELFTRYERRLGAFLAQITDRDTAEDVLQETFAAAYRERERVLEIENVEAWLFAVARNRALAALRSKRRRVALALRLGEARGDTVPDPAEAVAVRDLLVRNTTPEDRMLLVLRYVHGFDAPKLALVFGCSPDAVRQRLVRARRRFVDRVGAAGASTDGARAPVRSRPSLAEEYR